MAFERLQPFLPARIDVNGAVDRAVSANLWCDKGSKVTVQEMMVDWMAEPKEGGQVDAKAIEAQVKAMSAVAGKRKKKTPSPEQIQNAVRPKRKKGG